MIVEIVFILLVGAISSNIIITKKGEDIGLVQLNTFLTHGNEIVRMSFLTFIKLFFVSLLLVYLRNVGILLAGFLVGLILSLTFFTWVNIKLREIEIESERYMEKWEELYGSNEIGVGVVE